MYSYINATSMTIHITENRYLREVQKDFNDLFPFLKIEFFKKMHGVEKPSPAQRMFSQNLTVGDARTIKSEGDIDIDPTLTVSELEQSLWNRFGLSVQVFRKSGNLWLETTMTDKWTLGQQNDHGREISAPVEKTHLPADDFELKRGED